MSIIYHTRVVLIQLGKVLPFAVCFLVFVLYSEIVFALATNDLVCWSGYIIPNTPISWFIGKYCEYNVQTFVVLCVISVAIETCIYNKLACVYLGINLLEKWYFDFELDIWQIYVISIANVMVSWYFTIKGTKILLKSAK